MTNLDLKSEKGTRRFEADLANLTEHSLLCTKFKFCNNATRNCKTLRHVLLFNFQVSRLHSSAKFLFNNPVRRYVCVRAGFKLNLKSGTVYITVPWIRLMSPRRKRVMLTMAIKYQLTVACAFERMQLH